MCGNNAGADESALNWGACPARLRCLWVPKRITKNAPNKERGKEEEQEIWDQDTSGRMKIPYTAGLEFACVQLKNSAAAQHAADISGTLKIGTEQACSRMFRVVGYRPYPLSKLSLLLLACVFKLVGSRGVDDIQAFFPLDLNRPQTITPFKLKGGQVIFDNFKLPEVGDDLRLLSTIFIALFVTKPKEIDSSGMTMWFGIRRAVVANPDE
ncbi:hypothetical protein B0H11DRAFT_1925959 [Mycena galericulata]|nr:hypothetical protein B0H11DRAFT_1925959 [Mycena galericulata]